eukprot:scaffold18291_cov38-Prasinocladus_malaysianus.AAC.1
MAAVLRVLQGCDVHVQTVLQLWALEGLGSRGAAPHIGKLTACDGLINGATDCHFWQRTGKKSALRKETVWYVGLDIGRLVLWRHMKMNCNQEKSVGHYQRWQEKQGVMSAQHIYSAED